VEPGVKGLAVPDQHVHGGRNTSQHPVGPLGEPVQRLFRSLQLVSASMEPLNPPKLARGRLPPMERFPAAPGPESPPSAPRALLCMTEHLIVPLRTAGMADATPIDDVDPACAQILRILVKPLGD
jgi:hypothetical protein